MAKIIIQKNTGDVVREFHISANNVKNSPHSLLAIATTLAEILKVLDEVLDAEEPSADRR